MGKPDRGFRKWEHPLIVSVCLFCASLCFHLPSPLFCVLSLLLRVTLTSSALREMSRSCWSPSPTSSWHKVLDNIKDICTNTPRHVVICSHNWPYVSVSWWAVTQWWFSSFDLFQNEIKTLHFTGELRVIGTHVTSISHLHSYTWHDCHCTTFSCEYTGNKGL